ncbi:MAG: trigger factor [bacterium]|nr:trigger factor [bacterium]
MQITSAKTKGLKHDFKIKVPAKDVQNLVEQRLESLAKEVKVDGFRPGKVPLSVVRQRFSDKATGEALGEAVDQASWKALDEKKVKPALRPQYKIVSYDQGKDLEFEMSVEALPEIKAPKIESLTFEKLSAEISDKDVDALLKRTAENLDLNEPVEKARASKEGDTLIVDFEGRVGGKSLDDEKVKDFSFKIGSGRMMPEFEKQLTGKKPGETVEVNVKLPKDHSDKEFAGKEFIYNVEIKELREPKTIKLDDELATTLGRKNLDDLRKEIRGQMENESENRSFTHGKRQVLDALAEKTTFDIPQSLQEQEFKVIWDQLQHQMSHQAEGKKPAQKELDALKKQYEKLAERRVRLGLLLAQMGEEHKVTVSDKELGQAIMAQAQQDPQRSEEVIEYYQKNAEARSHLRAPIFENKVVRLVLDKAKVKDKKLPLEAFNKIVDEVTGDEA